MKLEIGMNLYKFDGVDNNVYRYTITRATDKRAFVEFEHGKIMFEREFTGDSVRAMGEKSSIWSSSYYKIETPELVKKFQRTINEKKFNKIGVRDLTDEQLEKILSIVEKE